MAQSRDFTEWMGKLRDSISGYTYYVDFSGSSGGCVNGINPKM
jgi:hypothetical protein